VSRSVSAAVRPTIPNPSLLPAPTKDGSSPGRRATVLRAITNRETGPHAMGHSPTALSATILNIRAPRVARSPIGRTPEPHGRVRPMGNATRDGASR
jgi:hypothetical protein